MANEIEVITTDRAPKPIAAFSQAVCFGELVFPCGQIGLDPKSGKLTGESVEVQTRQALVNLREVLKAAGSSLPQVVKVTLYLKDISEMHRVNDVYDEFFPANPPARSTVQVADLPLNARVEIDCIAIRA
jgi:2-iminobutanoate/2-iminopropanoate deaminase